ARSGVRRQIKIKAAAQDIVSEITAGVGLFDCGIDNFEDVAIFPANVDVSPMSLNGAPRDDDALDELVRGHLQQRPILASAGLALVGVAENIFRLAGILGDETPLHAGGKARAAAAAQIGFLYFIDDLIRRQLLEGA